MNEVDDRIVSFLKEQTCLTFATAAEGTPWCAHCFYAYDVENNNLIFKSSSDTLHIRQALLENRVAGTVNPDKLQKSRIRGLQFRGIFMVPDGELLSLSNTIYHKRYPFAAAVAGELWIIQPNHLKLTDNILGFGKKLIWERADL